MRRAFLAALIAAIYALPAVALADTTGTISGVIVDTATGAPIPGATVSVNGPCEKRSVITDETGHFTILAITPDTYTLTVEKIGYQTTAFPWATTSAGQVTYLKLNLSKIPRKIATLDSPFPRFLGVRTLEPNDVYLLSTSGIFDRWSTARLLQTVPGIVVIGSGSASL